MSDALPEKEDLVAEVFAEALDKSGTELAKYLDQACQGDERLHRRVQTLLGALPDAEKFFESSDLVDEIGGAATLVMSTSPSRSGQILGHYRLEKILGSGGMGEVYRAEDLALGRVCAVKLLRTGVDPHMRARLLKESEASARIEHPAVATFYEHGHADGQDYLALEFVRGSTLRDTLRDGKPSSDHSLALIFALLDGLVHAHAQGIVHRDIKPENIMVTPEGSPKLLDFGIAKEVHLPETRDENLRTATMLTALTGHGFIVGTMGYMSPEQLRGDVVSEQTDIFAIGAVLYEMLAGEPAFPGSTVRERMAATLSRDLPHLDLPDVHRDINAVLQRALARDCRDRYPNAAAFLRDLRDLDSGVRLSVLPNTVAILDLQNLTRNPDDDWIGTGVAESLGADLGRLTGLELVSRNKVLRVAEGHGADGVSPDPVEVGLALGCRWIMNGTYQKMGPRLRLTVRFVEVATGRDLWVEKLDGEPENLFDMQDRLAQMTADSLDLVLPRDEERKQSLSVHELYAKGRKILLTQRFTDITFAKDQFDKAIAIDPDFAPALSGQAFIHAPHLWYANADPALLDRGEELSRRAVAADPGFAEAHVSLGYALWRKGEFEEARVAFETAEKLEPSDHLPAYFLGCLNFEMGDCEAALVSHQRANEKAEDVVYVLSSLGYAHTLLGHYPEAEWAFKRAIDLIKGGDKFQWGGPTQLLSNCYLVQGRTDEAWNLCKELLDSMEASDHAVRGMWRLGGLQLLAEIAMARQDQVAAEVAIGQVVAAMEAQPLGPAKGHFLAQSLALQSIIATDTEIYRRARNLDKERVGMDFSWATTACEERTCFVLATAAVHHGENEAAKIYYARARQAGCRQTLTIP